MTKIIKIMVVFLVISFLNVVSVYAYQLTGAKWSSASMPVDWKLNSTGSADVGFANTLTAMQAAFDTWEATASTITLNYAGATGNGNWSYDGVNLMVFFENWGTYPGYGSNTIGVCRYWYSGGRTLESDIGFNAQNYTWSATGQAGRMDIENIAVHEIGHFLGLKDLYSGGDSAKTMYGYSSLGQTSKRSLHSDDISGVNALYPAGYPIMAVDPSGSYSWNNTSSGYPWRDIAVGDFDGDGDGETVTIRSYRATWGSRGYPIMITDPGGEMSWSHTSSGYPWRAITAGDFDGDGSDEIAVIRSARATWGSRGYPIMIQDPAGADSVMSWSHTSSGYVWSDIAAGDFDGDGYDEIAVIRNARATWGSRGYPIMIIDPDGPDSVMSWSHTSSGYPWRAITAGDFDGDGYDEIAVIRSYRATWGSRGYPIMIIDPPGPDNAMSWNNTSSGYAWTDIAAGDFDGDGYDEIVVIRNARATWGSRGYPLLVIDPTGADSVISWDNTSSGYPWSRISAGDIDDDVDDDAEIAVIRSYRATW